MISLQFENENHFQIIWKIGGLSRGKKFLKKKMILAGKEDGSAEGKRKEGTVVKFRKLCRSKVLKMENIRVKFYVIC